MSTSRRGIVWVIAVVLAGVGGILIGMGLSSRQHPPQPAAAQANSGVTTITPDRVTTTVTVGAETAASPTPSSVARRGAGSSRRATPTTTPGLGSTQSTTTSGGTTSPTPTSTQLVLAASVPLSITIPSIGAQSTLLRLGLNPDKSIEVPPLDEPESRAGWYKYSPTPGQIGPTVILGHVDSARHGPAVFFKLGALQPGAAVEVTLTDRMVAVFTVEKVVAYQKSEFPTDAVYGDIDYPGLRLITCGGTFDAASGSYEGSIVAYAKLTSSRRSS